MSKSLNSHFTCPYCKEPIKTNNLICNICKVTINYYESIPILIKNYDSIRSQIEKAKKEGKQDWYEASQDIMWKGSYRHHLLKRKKYVEQVLKKYGDRNNVESLLDLGCGDGANLGWLKSYTRDLYGSDYNIIRLARAKNCNLAKEIVLADITDYPAKNNSFNIIFFNHVLEHINDDITALSEVYRILKKDGLCILGIPNEGAFWWQLAYKLQPQSLNTTDHVHFYTLNTISKKVTNIGFKIQETKKLGWGLPHWTLDSIVRGYKFIDDLFELFGKVIIPNQASCLYLVLEK